MQHFQEVRYGNVRKCLWLTLENPGYSVPSKLFSLVSIGVVLTSIATMCINSMPEYQVSVKRRRDHEHKLNDEHFYFKVPVQNMFAGQLELFEFEVSNCDRVKDDP